MGYFRLWKTAAVNGIRAATIVLIYHHLQTLRLTAIPTLFNQGFILISLNPTAVLDVIIPNGWLKSLTSWTTFSRRLTSVARLTTLGQQIARLDPMMACRKVVIGSRTLNTIPTKRRVLCVLLETTGPNGWETQREKIPTSLSLEKNVAMPGLMIRMLLNAS